MKIGFFITARLKSSRLKRKILLDLNGKSVLDRVIERAKKVKGTDGVVLCTSTNPQDSELYKNALSNQIEFYPGSEEDVLKRLLDAAEYYGYDAFISITADNPVFSVETSEQLIQLYNKHKYDFINTKGLPIGCNTYLLDVKALKVVMYIKKLSDTEIWGPFINKPEYYNVADLFVKNCPIDDKIRITLDYKEDYILMKEIYSHFKPNQIPTTQEFLMLLAKNQHILNINKGREQRGVSTEVLAQIENSYQSNWNQALKYANSIDKSIRHGYSQHEMTM